ncbi:hypothetical protein GCM10010404_39530 [Nonomuraea africana]
MGVSEGSGDIDRTAYPRFTRAVLAGELAEVFTPSDGEEEWARGKRTMISPTFPQEQDALGPSAWLEGVPPGKVAHFAVRRE